MRPPAVWKRSRLPGTWSCKLQESSVGARLRAPDSATVSFRRPANSLIRVSLDWTSIQTFDGPCEAGAGGSAAKDALESAMRTVSRGSARHCFIVGPVLRDGDLQATFLPEFGQSKGPGKGYRGVVARNSTILSVTA